MKCPACGRVDAVNPISYHNWYCGHCKMMFDDDPDEGGTHHDRDPSRRLEREESRPKKVWPKRA